MKVSVIICAAGRGERAGFAQNKLLTPLPFYGCTVLEKTVRAFLLPFIDEIIVAVNPTDKGVIADMLAPYAPICRLTDGGDTRTKSVKNALAAVTGEIVLIHDGARPFVGEKVIFDCIESVKRYKSGVCSLPATDTTVLGDNGEVKTALNRGEVFTVQTPQGFFTSDMVRAYSMIGEETYTDDSAVYARFIGAPHLFSGARENRKLTYPEDFFTPARVGVGIDTHAFGKEQDYIVLAGVKIPSDSGLIAHSDGDVLTHAVMDALLSAAGLRDIGYYFPDTDEKWKNANSM